MNKQRWYLVPKQSRDGSQRADVGTLTLVTTIRTLHRELMGGIQSYWNKNLISVIDETNTERWVLSCVMNIPINNNLNFKQHKKQMTGRAESNDTNNK